MVKFRRRLLENWSPASWIFFLCDKFIFAIYIKKFAKIQFFRLDINLFMQPFFRHCDSNFRFCYKPFSWIRLNPEHKISTICAKTSKNEAALTYQNYAEFASSSEQEGAFNQNFHEIIAKAFFINTTTNENIRPTQTYV